MIKKDIRYIIKRIIIGVGIVFVVSCFNGCKVKALTLFSGVEVPDVDNIVGDNAFYISYFDDNELHLIYQPNNVDNLHMNNVPPYFSWIKSSRVYWLEITTNGNNISVAPNAKWKYSGTVGQGFSAWTDPDKTVLSCLNYYYTNTGSCSVNDRHPYHSYFNKNILYSNGEIYRNVSLYSAYMPSKLPEFISFNAIPITNNNVITSYTIQPEFTNFNTDNYIYQYSFDKKRWLSLTENNQLLRINNNGTIYVRIKDKNTNDIIDSATFTISNIGTFYNNQDYKINFSGDYRTENYLNDNISSKSQSIIKEYQIYIDYVPKSSILTYQYQYVPTDSQLDNNNWQNVSSSDNGSITYVTTENGTLYARILDKENNVLKTGSFTVNSIGLLAFDNNEQGINNFFTKLSNKISYGGPISNLFRIPIDILNKIYSYSSSSCSPYKISTLFGTDISLPCIDFKAEFGSNFYHFFDSLLCFILSLCLFKFVRNIYDKFINMEDISS